MPDKNSCHITFCLCPGFPLFCIASALEVLRHANRFTADRFYTWSLLCEDDEPIQDSNNLWLSPSTTIEKAVPSDMVFVVAGFEPTKIETPNIAAWLKKQASAGRIVGGISNGGFLLAQVKLLEGFAATVHWEDFATFCVLYPRVKTRYQRYLIDRKRITCSGGTSTLDLFVEIVRKDLGNDLSLMVSRQMLLQGNSNPREPETESILAGGQHFSFRVQRALSLIDPGVEQRMNVTQLAERVGLSRRQLLRLFRREIGKTPGEILIQRRLERAQSLLLHSHLPIAVISNAVGFCSQSHLTTSYRKHFDITPAEQRRNHQVKN
jgi:transcriptional regulator GlxA family with amidase domain